MQATVREDHESKPMCDLPLCGRPAVWEVDLFGKVEHYCERHRPGIPEKFMTIVNHP